MSGSNDEELDPRLEDGGEPTEEVGPEECGAAPERCDFDPEMHSSGPGDATWSPDDELQEAFAPQPFVAMIDAEDHMARPADPHGGLATGTAPPFTLDHMVCLGDDRTYVEVFKEELPDDWKLSDGPSGPRVAFPGRTVSLDTTSQYDSTGNERPRRDFARDQVKRLWGQLFVPGHKNMVVPVRPRRPKCKHYRRQVFNIDGESHGLEDVGNKHQFQNCMARRSNGGALMSLNKQAVFACDYRDPPDPTTTERWNDRFDRKRLKDKPHLTLIAPLGLGDEEIRLPDPQEKPAAS